MLIEKDDALAVMAELDAVRAELADVKARFEEALRQPVTVMKIDQDMKRIWTVRPQMTPEQQEAQRRSFAFGNANIHNPNVTRELVDRVADEMAGKRSPDLAAETPVVDADEG